eukprot:6191411-Pleurochrysis_carterae.AAC.2
MRDSGCRNRAAQAHGLKTAVHARFGGACRATAHVLLSMTRLPSATMSPRCANVAGERGGEELGSGQGKYGRARGRETNLQAGVPLGL